MSISFTYIHVVYKLYLKDIFTSNSNSSVRLNLIFFTLIKWLIIQIKLLIFLKINLGRDNV